MPGSEYTAVTGGALKLKGGGGAIDKKKMKKKKPKPDDGDSNNDTAVRAYSGDEAASASKDTKPVERDLAKAGDEPSEELQREVAAASRPKTEAERKFEEARRKKVRCVFRVFPWRSLRLDVKMIRTL